MPTSPKKTGSPMEDTVMRQGALLFASELRKVAIEKERQDQIKLINSAEDKAVGICMDTYAESSQKNCITAVKNTSEKARSMVSLLIK